MTYITKESVYDLLTDLETVYPDAAKAFRLVVSEMPEGLTRCKDCENAEELKGHMKRHYVEGAVWCYCWLHQGVMRPDCFCANGASKEGAE